MRRRRSATLFYIEAILQLINLLVWLAGNADVLVHRCAWFSLPVTWLSWVSWTCWNCQFATATVRCSRSHAWGLQALYI